MDLPTLAATDFDTWTGERAPGHEEGGGARGGDEAEDGEPASGVRRPTGRSVDGAPDPRRDRAGAGGRVRPRAG
jgi:hypothetical protein